MPVRLPETAVRHQPKSLYGFNRFACTAPAETPVRFARFAQPVQSDKVEELKAFLKADLPDTGRFEGCQAVSIYQDEDVPASIVVWGTWDSRGHFEKYLAWRTARGDQEALGAMLAEPPAVSYLDPVDA